MSGKTCIVILGPTAGGKTKLSLQLADIFNTEIISADSRQCHKELNIGVAKPSNRDLARIRHYFINSHSVSEEVNAAIFEKYALAAAKEIFAEKDYAVMVGGTGLYIRAFCEGLDEMPPIDETVRQSLREKYTMNGMTWLHEMVQKHDPLFYEKGEIYNPHRLLRALEVKMSFGKSILELHTSANKQRPFNLIKIGLALPREVLYEQISRRVDFMMAEGLMEEVITLKDYRYKAALQTVGYTELFEYLDGRTTLETATDRIKINTRRYAKRQLTWFRREPGVIWFAPDQEQEIIKYIRMSVNSEPEMS